MKKIMILVAVAMMLPFAASAQKLAHINSADLLKQMPEKAQVEAKLDTIAKEYEKELLAMQEEYYAKVKDYQDKSKTMSEAIRGMREQEIQEMAQRIQTFQQTAQQDIQKQQETLFAPVIEKVKKAITEVGAEQGFAYVFDLASQTVVYVGDNTTDILPLVKAKLGLK